MANFNSLFPCPSKESLQDAFVGKHLQDVPAPAAILDRAVIKDNCNQMLRACQLLGVQFRPHVKTHKVHVLAFHVGIVLLRSIFNIQSPFERQTLLGMMSVLRFHVCSTAQLTM